MVNVYIIGSRWPVQIQAGGLEITDGQCGIRWPGGIYCVGCGE